MDELRYKLAYENLPADYRNTFSTFTNLLNFIGIDIFGAKLGRTNVKASLRLFTFVILYVPFIMLQFSMAVRFKADNFLDGAMFIPTMIIGTLDLIKMPASILMKDHIYELFMVIGDMWPKGLDDGEKKSVTISWLKGTGLLIKSFFIYTSVNLVLFEFVPLLMTLYNLSNGVEEYLFPFKSPWPINSFVAYIATLAWEVIPTVPSQICLYHAYDFIIIIITLNISFLFRILEIDLKDVIKASCATRDNRSVSDKDFDQIKKVVVRHQKLFSLVDKLNHCFGLVVFTHTALSSLLICFFCYLTVAYKDVVRTIANIISTVNMISTIFLLALAGQLLCDRSAGVADAAYNSVWYESDLKVKRLVLFIIIRSQKPCYLSALNYSTMNLTSFSKICSSAWTYLSLIFQMQDDI